MQHYPKLLETWHRVHLYSSSCSVLGWDQNCVMPPAAAAFRGEQIGFLSQLAHQEMSSDAYETLLKKSFDEVAELGSLDPRRRNVERALRLLKREKSLSAELVNDWSRATVEGQTAWEEAKQKRDFSLFKKPLQKIIALSLQRAELFGYEKTPYDALLPDYEWGFDSQKLDEIFVPLQAGLTALLRSCQKRDDISFRELGTGFSPALQEQLGRELALSLGFGFDDGVLLTSSHPFSTTLGPRDFRITTRYSEKDFLSSFSAVAHEVGHSLYERGLPQEYLGQPVGSASSAGIHESQSLFWEKRIAQSQPFLKAWTSKFRQAFPEQLAKLSGDDLYRQANRVRSSLIRVDADEVSYSLHIIIRYELEKALINERLPLDELPQLWNEKYQSYLGITPSHLGEGCLQDIHWSCGSFGYFPSYALGHLFSAQFAEAMEKDLGSLDRRIEAQDFGRIRQWLKDKIHSRGASFDSQDLIREVSGRELSIEPFMIYLQQKVGTVYQ